MWDWLTDLLWIGYETEYQRRGPRYRMWIERIMVGLGVVVAIGAVVALAMVLFG